MKQEPNEQGTQAHARIIREFWDSFGGGKNDGAGFSQEAKRKAVVELAAVRISYGAQKTLATRREAFDRNKRTRHSMRAYGRCFICSRPACDRHHLIQLKNGGINSKRNLVSLCHECHAEVHPWMKRPIQIGQSA